MHRSSFAVIPAQAGARASDRLRLRTDRPRRLRLLALTATVDQSNRSANALALGAIALWGSLAWLGVRLSTMPPFLLVGTALTTAGLLASPTWRAWRVAPRVLALGVYGLFGFHFFLFVALRLAPPLEANLVNYLWPLLIVLLAPLFLHDTPLSRRGETA